MKIKAGLIILLLISFQSVASNWKYNDQKYGINTYSREIKNSQLKEYMAVATFNAPIELIGLVLLDINNHKNWIADCEKSRIIKHFYGNFSNIRKINKGGLMQYYAIGTPWPVQSRDVIIRTDFNINWKKGKLSIRCLSIKRPHIYKNNKYFRMEEIAISWYCTRVNKNTTKVIYQLKSNPGGTVPISLANGSTQKMPLKTLINLKKECKKKIYTSKYKRLFQN